MSFIKKSIFNMVSVSAIEVLSVLFAFLFLMITNVLATNYYIAPNGNDRNDGLTISTPWKTVVKGIRSAKPDDTVYLRGGIYRQDISLGPDRSSHFSTKATASSRITFKSYPGEMAVITSMQLRDKPHYWKKVPGYDHVYMANLKPNQLRGKYSPIRISNCSQEGIPLTLMTGRNDNGGPSLLIGPGQWVRNTEPNVFKIYVWSRDGRNPGNSRTEICEFPRGGTCTVGLYLDRSKSYYKSQPDYITFENLTIEGGYHALLIETNNIEVRNCTFRNSHACGIKVGGAKPKNFNKPDDPLDKDYYNSVNCIVLGCDISYFGWTGIDLTGGDDWVIKNTSIHDGVQTRGKTIDVDNYVSAGIILKNNCKRAVVQNNKFFNMNVLYGAITMGGSSWGNIADEAVGCVVHENEIYNIAGPCVLLFMAAKNCSFRDNLVRDCRLSNAIIRFASGNTGNPKFLNRDCSVVNNTFFNNQVSSGFFYKIPTGTVVNLKSDYNTFQPLMGHLYNDEFLTMEQFRELGYEKNMKTKILGIDK